MGLVDDVMKNMGGLEGMASMAAKNPQLIAAAATLLSSKDSSIGGDAGLSGLMSAFDVKVSAALCRPGWARARTSRSGRTSLRACWATIR